MNHPLPEADYSWPVCATPNCGRELWVAEAGRLVCRPCEDRAGKHLAELPGLFARLNETVTLQRGARKVGEGAGGSRVPPIPPRLEVLALTAAGGVATRLEAIEDAWRQALGWRVEPRTDGRRVYPAWRTNPVAAVPRHIRFLVNNLPWAVEAYEEVGQDIEDLRRLHAECTAVVADERRPGRVGIGRCPTMYDDGPCGADLTASAGSHRIRCGSCGARWETLGEWRVLRQAQENVWPTDAGVAA
jgi:hypothetical protein